MTAPEKLAEDLVPLAAELVGTIRDYGPDDVAEVLARVPDGRFDALAIVLAAMVDPDARPKQLLAWTELGPVRSRDVEPRHLTVRRVARAAPSKRSEVVAEVARLTENGLSAAEIADRLGTTPRSVNRYRATLRESA